MSHETSDGAELDLDAVAPTVHAIQAVLSRVDVSEASKRRLVARAYLGAASNNRIELLEYLLSDSDARCHLDVNAVDEDGTPALILAAFTGYGEVVRLLLEQQGADVNARDARGWTALMWAFQTNNFPLSSFLINRRASPTMRSYNGLAPIDLIRKGPAGDVFRSVLQDFHEQEDLAQALNKEGRAPVSATTEKQPCRRASVVSLPASPSANSIRLGKHSSLPTSKSIVQIAQEKEQQTNLDLAIESAQTLQLELDLLDISGSREGLSMHPEALSTLAEEAEGQSDEALPPFDWEECQSEQMLAFSYQDLSAILDLATDTRPSRKDDTRFMPANVIFLAARYASRYAGEDLLGELMIGAIDRIEASIHLHAQDLANSAFWLSNSILLLYYLRRDPHTAENTLEYQDNLHDLIREIFVFCIRDTERRLDKLLDAAILEHEALPGFDDIRFEGEWRFVKALTSRSKKDSSFPSAAGLGSGSSSRPSVLGLFASPDRAGTPHTPQSTPPSKLVSPRSRAPSMPTGKFAGSGSPGLPSSPQDLSPGSVTGLLSSTLFILQHYDFAGHPCIVVQAFSQLLYWMASELFNRILSKKRYLCRSRAVQIRLNISSLEDWARVNQLPTQMVQAHFRPLNELLQWLQCLSSESSIDGLLGTMQSLRTLNPVQMRKAVKEYRYEVEETKMSEECAQYLAQLQKDWERRRLLQGVQETEEQVTESFSSANSSQLSISLSDDGSESTRESSRTSDLRTEIERHIDEVFGDNGEPRYQKYEPPARPECFNELLDSRAMLPFALPTSNDALLHFRREAFKPTPRHAVDNASGHSTPVMRNSSTQSEGSMRSSQFGLAELSPTPTLPETFLSQLKEAQSHYYMEEAPQLRMSGRHERRVSSMSASGRDDHWLNWRQRMDQELAQTQDEVDQETG